MPFAFVFAFQLLKYEHMHANTVLTEIHDKIRLLADTVIAIVCVAQRWLAKYRVWCVFLCERIFVFEGVSKTTHSAQCSYTTDAIFLLVYTDFMPVFGLCFYLYFGVCACVGDRQKRTVRVSIARFRRKFNQRRKMLIDQQIHQQQMKRGAFAKKFIFHFSEIWIFSIFLAMQKNKTKHLNISICISFTFQLDIFTQNRWIEPKGKYKRIHSTNTTGWNVNDFDWIFSTEMFEPLKCFWFFIPSRAINENRSNFLWQFDSLHQTYIITKKECLSMISMRFFIVWVRRKLWFHLPKTNFEKHERA